MIDRFCFLGEIDDHTAKLEEFRALGVDQVALYVMHDRIDETMAEYGESIISGINA